MPSLTTVSNMTSDNVSNLNDLTEITPPSLTLPFLYLTLSLILFSINCLFVIIFIKSRKLKKGVFFQFAFSMSIADGIQLFEFITYCAPSSIMGGRIFGDRGDPIFGTISNAVWYTSTATLFFQAVNRFVAVQFPNSVDIVFSKRNGLIYIALTWMVGCTLSTLNINPDGYQKWSVTDSAWLYVNNTYGFVDLGYTCTFLMCVFVLHGIVFCAILKHDKAKNTKSQSTEEIALKKREIKQFMQFFFITLFPFIYELVGNILPNFINTTEAIEVFTMLNTIMLILDAGANGFTYVMANEAVNEEMLVIFPLFRKIFNRKPKENKVFGSVALGKTVITTHAVEHNTKPAWH